MDKNTISRLTGDFEQHANTKDGIEFWYARDLQVLLGYDRWENFVNALKKARHSCHKSGNDVSDHFRDVTKMVILGSGSEREIDDTLLTRYACYLIAQNGDPRKEKIAFAQTYFALQTRKQELIEARIALKERIEARGKLSLSEIELSKLIFERGVDRDGFARIRSKGDEALFGGLTTSELKARMDIPKSRPMADFLPTVTISAKNLATEITNFKVRQNSLQGEPPITAEHVKNNKEIRAVLKKNNIIPENLPKEEDIKQLEKKLEGQDRRIAEASKARLLKDRVRVAYV